MDIGVDTIDLDAATQAGSSWTNNPTYCIEEVAEQTMALDPRVRAQDPFLRPIGESGAGKCPPETYYRCGAALGWSASGNIARHRGARRSPRCAFSTPTPS